MELCTSPKQQAQAAPTSVWTWAECVAARLRLLSGNRVVARRIKISSTETRSDVRSAFGIDRKTGAFIAEKRPSLAVLQEDILLTDLNASCTRQCCTGNQGRTARVKIPGIRQLHADVEKSKPQCVQQHRSDVSRSAHTLRAVGAAGRPTRGSLNSSLRSIVTC
jgi:hypothetical protein